MNPHAGADAVPGAPARRPPMTVRTYFVAPPDERDRSLGTIFLIAGVAAIFVAFTLPLGIAGAVTSSDPSDPSGSSGSAGLVISLLLALGIFIAGNLIGWPLLIAAGMRLYQYQRQRNARVGAPSDEQMDRWFMEDMRETERRAAREMNIPPETITRRPLLVVGPSLPTDYAIGRDGRPRYASYEVAVVLLTEYQLCAYTCVLNFTTGVRELEATHEFMLTDVTSIATVNDRLANHGASGSPGNLIRMAGPIAMSYLTPADISIRQEFRVTLTSGDAIAVNVGCHVNGTPLTDENFRGHVRNTVKALRATLREIKSPTNR